MNDITVLGGGWGIILWVIVTYIPFGICLRRVGCGGAGAGCVVCFGFAVKTSLTFLLYLYCQL